MARNAKDNENKVEETQDGAEQPVVESTEQVQEQEPTVTELEQLAQETEAPQETYTEYVQVTTEVDVPPTSETPTEPGTPVSEIKQTPNVISETNKAKAAALRVQYAERLDAIGNNMSEKIRMLHREGLSKGDISRVLQIQFQFVRNVVFNADMKAEKEARDAAAKAVAEQAKAS